MAGSSHWFQVHDQLSFAILKKTMRDSLYKYFGVSSTEPGATVKIRMAEFYEAEKSAFNPKAVRDSFAMVGLHPWDKKLILKNCRENSPVDPESGESSMIDDLAKKICMYSDKKRDEIESIRSTVKHAEKEYRKSHVQDDDGEADTSGDKSMSETDELHKKRAKSMHVDRKICASEG